MITTTTPAPVQLELASSPLIEDLTPGMATIEKVALCFCNSSCME
jgi:hypothetical protein